MYVANQPLEKLPIDDLDADTLTTSAPIALNKDILRNIIFKYLKTSGDVLKLMLGLHTWNLVPKLVIIDSLHKYFVEPTTTMCNGELVIGPTPTNYNQFIENHCLLTASVQNALDALSIRLNGHSFSIISIDFKDEHFAEFYNEFQKTFLDLYYYKANVFHRNGNDLVSVVNELLNPKIK